MSMFKEYKTERHFKQQLLVLPGLKAHNLVREVFLLWRKKETRIDDVDDFKVSDKEFLKILASIKK